MRIARSTDHRRHHIHDESRSAPLPRIGRDRPRARHLSRSAGGQHALRRVRGVVARSAQSASTHTRDVRLADEAHPADVCDGVARRELAARRQVVARRTRSFGPERELEVQVYRLFRSIMTSAVEDGPLPSNPIAIRGASKERIIERPLLTWDDVGALAEAIDPRFHAFVWTAAASGLRFGELSGLTVGKFDVERSSITVSQALSARNRCSRDSAGRSLNTAQAG